MAAMNDVPKELLRAAYKRNSIHLLKVPLGYGLWAATVWVLLATQHHRFAIPIGIACSIFIAYLIRGLGAVAHDAVHGNLSRSKTVSYWLALFGWAPTGMALTLYRNYHLHHHRIANTYPDVDNFVVTDYTRNPFLAKLLLMSVYTFGYPIYFAIQMGRYTKRLSSWEKVRMVLELVGTYAVIGLAFYLLPLQVWLFFFIVPFIFGAILASITSMIEHFGMPETDDDAYSSRTYGTRCHITNFLWNNVTYHNEHHKYPGIPFYNLKSFHHAAYPHYDDQIKAACHKSIYGLAFQLYGEILSLDIDELARKYAHLDKTAEKQKMMNLDGIPVEQPAA